MGTNKFETAVFRYWIIIINNMIFLYCVIFFIHNTHLMIYSIFLTPCFKIKVETIANLICLWFCTAFSYIFIPTIRLTNFKTICVIDTKAQRTPAETPPEAWPAVPTPASRRAGMNHRRFVGSARFHPPAPRPGPLRPEAVAHDSATPRSRYGDCPRAQISFSTFGHLKMPGGWPVPRDCDVRLKRPTFDRQTLSFYQYWSLLVDYFDTRRIWYSILKNCNTNN